MSNTTPSRPDRRPAVELPSGVVLRSYEQYRKAEAAVEDLLRADLPPRSISIIGNDLKSVERVAGRRSYAKAALNGAMLGAWLGLFVGGMQFLTASEAQQMQANATSMAPILLFAAGVGMIIGVVMFALNRSARSFGSTSYFVAGSYDLVVDPQHAAKARSVLGIAITGGAVPPPPTQPSTTASDEAPQA